MRQREVAINSVRRGMAVSRAPLSIVGAFQGSYFSKPWLDRAALPPDVVANSIGAQLLGSKAERLELFAVEHLGVVREASQPH